MEGATVSTGRHFLSINIFKMTEQEIAIMQAYHECRAALGYFRDNNLLISLAALYTDAKKDAKENRCRCANLRLDNPRAYWVEPWTFKQISSEDRVMLIPVTFNHCPECGRKLSEHEKR